LLRKHISNFLNKLFAEFTGLHFHIAWMPAWPKGWDAHRLPTGCSVCCKLSGSPLLSACRTCGPHHLAATLVADDGHRFTCRLGVRNYWLRICLRNETVGIAYLQALKQSAVTRACGNRAAAPVLSEAKFGRAGRLLRLMVQHVETASLCDLSKADLCTAGRAVVALEREQARLHSALHRYLPSAQTAPRESGPESRGEQIVRDLLERIELDYAKPITLQRYAREAGLNGAYLSALFSRAVGTPFKGYLTQLRLDKAKQLFEDAARTTSDVAFAVGYASEERFRCAFKKGTGLSPKAWRETMQTKLPREAAWQPGSPSLPAGAYT
jgi:AraC-like DNA-binding protein